MKIELSVKDRLVIIAMLPTEGKMTDLVEIMDLIKLIKFTDDERKEIELQEKDGRLHWNISKEIDKDIELNFDQIRIVKSTIKDLDDRGKIDFNTLDTCLKFSKL